MIPISEKINSLSKSNIFSTIPREQLAEIAGALKTEKLPPNKVLFRMGDPGGSFYIVYSGRLRVFLEGEDGVETDLNWLGPGDSFGEMALLTDEPRSSNVEAVQETLLLVLRKQEFDAILGKYPVIYKNCIKHVTQLLKRDEKRLIAEVALEQEISRLKWSDFVFIGTLVLLFALIFNFTNPNRIDVFPEFHDSSKFPRIDFSEAKQKLDQGTAVFIDARPAQFYDDSHIKGAINLPLPSFEINYMYMPEEQKNKDVIIYGRSVGALYDAKVADQLDLFGRQNITILKGTKQYLPLRWFALDTWKEMNYPMEGQGHE